MAKIKRKAVIKSPSTFFLYGEQKTGKTSALLDLLDCVLWDCHKGSLAYEGYIKEVNNYNDLIKFAEENIKAAPEDKFKIVAIDSALDIVTMLAPRALEYYKNSLSGNDLKAAQMEDWYKNPASVNADLMLNLLSYGKGAEALTSTFVKFFNYIKSAFEKVIFVGHSKLNSTQTEKTHKLIVKEMDLPNKIKDFLLRNCDQIGMVYRKDNTLIADFAHSEESAKLGGRFDYLEGEKIVLSIKQDGEFKTNWHKIFPDIYGISKEDLMKEKEEELNAQKALQAALDNEA